MKQGEAGFTLIELLVAMTAASLLLASLSWSVSRLGVQLRASENGNADELVAFEPVLQSMVASVRPAEEGMFRFSRNEVRFSAVAPGSTGAMGTVRVRIAIGKDGQGRFLEGDVQSEEDRRLSRQFRMNGRWDDIHIAPVGEDGQGEPSGMKMDFRRNSERTSLVAVSRVNSSTDCIFDLISMACRP